MGRLVGSTLNNTEGNQQIKPLTAVQKKRVKVYSYVQVQHGRTEEGAREEASGRTRVH
jgi:hypothetical protein